MRDLIFTE